METDERGAGELQKLKTEEEEKHDEEDEEEEDHQGSTAGRTLALSSGLVHDVCTLLLTAGSLPLQRSADGHFVLRMTRHREDAADETAKVKRESEEKHKDELDVRWLVSALPPYLLGLLTSDHLNKSAVLEGVEVLHKLAKLINEAPSIVHGMVSSADVLVELLWCLLAWQVSDYCKESCAGSGKHAASDETNVASAKNHYDSTHAAIVEKVATILSCALKAELIQPHYEEMVGDGEHPLLETFLRHERLDDIIGAFIDSLRLLIYHYHQRQEQPSSSALTNEDGLCKLVESIYLLCFSDDFARRLTSHSLFAEGHVLQALAHILQQHNVAEAALGSALGMLSILCEKQQPEFLALAHQYPATHTILRHLIELAKRYLDLVRAGQSAQGDYRETTYARIFHCLVLFADHPQYKAALIRPGGELLWKFLTLPLDTFTNILADASRRGVLLHLLHFLISLALPCPTASWEDITGGRATQLGGSMLVEAMHDLSVSDTSKQDGAAELAVGNLERTVSALYASDDIHFPIEHLLTLQSLATSLRSALLPASVQQPSAESGAPAVKPAGEESDASEAGLEAKPNQEAEKEVAQGEKRKIDEVESHGDGHPMEVATSDTSDNGLDQPDRGGETGGDKQEDQANDPLAKKAKHESTDTTTESGQMEV